ncbi:hypothetical protein M3P21_22395, partial [Ruegeria sp. 2012CJ41-6]
VALNDTAFVLRDELGEHLDEISEGGATPFTKRTFRVSKRSTKRSLEAEVLSKDKQSEYLVPALTGGVRSKGDYATGRAGVLIPVEGKLNKYGNLPRGSLKRQLNRPDTFLGRVGDDDTLAVLKRKRRTKKNRKGGLQVLAVFKEKVKQRALRGWDLEGVSERVFQKVMLKNMNEAVADLARHGKVRSRKARDGR